MILGIDASNIKAGGGLVHLKNLLLHAEPMKYGISKVVVWGGDQLDVIEDTPWLQKIKPAALVEGGFRKETIWKATQLEKLALAHCDFVFAPGGTFYSKKIPYVSMSQNMLVFDKKERDRYFFSFDWLRLNMLHFIQSRSLKNATANIFISHFAKEKISKNLGIQKKDNTVVYHGIAKQFVNKTPIHIKTIKELSDKNPFKILYVSIVDVYKHQWILSEAVSRLRTKDGLPIELTMIGGSYAPSLSKLNQAIERFDPEGRFLHYLGKKPHQELKKYYFNSDLFAFSSTCENLPNIIIEAMSAGLPIVSGDYGPMQELLSSDAQLYDPTSVDATYECLKKVVTNADLRAKMRDDSLTNNMDFSWKDCADATFEFLSKTSHQLQE